MPKSKHNCWKLSSVNLEIGGQAQARLGWVDRGVDDGGVTVLLFAELLKESILVDIDGRHFDCKLKDGGPRGELVCWWPWNSLQALSQSGIWP